MGKRRSRSEGGEMSSTEGDEMSPTERQAGETPNAGIFLTGERRGIFILMPLCICR